MKRNDGIKCDYRRENNVKKGTFVWDHKMIDRQEISVLQQQQLSYLPSSITSKAIINNIRKGRGKEGEREK